jgi:hypothetical protein
VYSTSQQPFHALNEQSVINSQGFPKRIRIGRFELPVDFLETFGNEFKRFAHIASQTRLQQGQTQSPNAQTAELNQIRVLQAFGVFQRLMTFDQRIDADFHRVLCVLFLFVFELFDGLFGFDELDFDYELVVLIQFQVNFFFKLHLRKNKKWLTVISVSFK